MNQRRSKYWMFTINNPATNEEPATWPHVEYCVWQREVGENSTPHLQGYVIFEGAKQMSWLKSSVNGRAHWEARQGTHAQAKEYCTKEDTRRDGPWSVGDEPEVADQGKRMDLTLLKRKLDTGVTEKAIAESEDSFGIWLKYHKAIQRYRMLKRAGERNWHTFCLVLWGPPGVGKSRRAHEEAGPGAYWLRKPSPNSPVWFDGYDGEETVVIDEFYGWIARDLMQRMCDRYPLLVDTKGGATPFLAKKVIITSNEPPANWWKKIGLGAMQRRLEGACGRVEYMGPDPLVVHRVSELVPAYRGEMYWDELFPYHDHVEYMRMLAPIEEKKEEETVAVASHPVPPTYAQSALHRSVARSVQFELDKEATDWEIARARDMDRDECARD